MTTSLTRRQWLQQTTGALAGISLAAGQTPKQRPNIFFFAFDDLRPEFGCYGFPYVKSPNLDRIAQQGMVFNRAYCQQAVCSPSRSSLMTGARPDSTKVWDLVTHFRAAMPNVVTLPQHFKQHGYLVQGMGKIFDGGYDDEPSWSVPWQTPDAPTYTVNTKPPKSAKGKQKNGPAFEAGDVADEFYNDGQTADLAVQALRSRKGKAEPFFLAVGFFKPHLPFVSPKKYWDLYDPVKIQLASNPYRPKDAPEHALATSGELRNYTGMPAEGPVPDELARKLKHGYYAAIS